jgi:flagellar biosynthesis protein
VAQTPAPPDDKAAARRQLAVALAGQGDRDRPPRVTAKGEGSVAEQILAIAFERGVKVRTDPDLAEVLHAVELDSEVPLEALAAVAEILSYLYRTGHGPGAETLP